MWQSFVLPSSIYSHDDLRDFSQIDSSFMHSVKIVQTSTEQAVGMAEAEVIVVGAGLSGLSAAKWLKERGVSVLVLEARDRVGGRLLTKKDPSLEYVDLGGSYVGPTQNRIFRMAKELGVKNYEVKEEADLLYYKNGKRMRFQDGFAPRQNIFVNMDINNILWLVDELGEQVPIEAPWNALHAEEWDYMTLQQFLEKNCWTKAARDFMKYFVNLNITIEPHEASLLSVLWYIRQCGGTKRIHSAKNGAQERKFIGGSQQICELIAGILGDAVIINSPVIGINQERKDYVSIQISNEKSYKANYVILACPPILQMKMHFSPCLPPLRNQLIQRLPMGAVMKVIMYYKRPFWREIGLCGTMFIEGNEEHPVFSTMDDTKPDGKYPALVGFISTDKLCRLIHLKPEERRDLFAKSLREATKCHEALHPIHYEEKDWMTEEFSGGGYTAVYPPGFFTRYGKILREPIDRLFFAGTETAVGWSGYMEGAIEAGERAAGEILYAMGKIGWNEIWMEEPPSTDVIAEPFERTWTEKLTPSIPGLLKMMAFLIFLLTILFAII